MRNSVYAALRSLRESAGLSVEEAAVQIGCSEARVLDSENPDGTTMTPTFAAVVTAAYQSPATTT